MVKQPRVLVFTGPTLSEDEVLEILPHATVFAPIAGGDLWRLNPSPEDTLVVIDGYYFQTIAIRHKELAALCDKGVRVIGAGSMGALRACELAPFGMIGVGKIFNWYLTGVIDGDDEIAVVHDKDAETFHSYTIALVNLRSTLSAAVAAGACDGDFAANVIQSVRGMPFSARTQPQIVEAVSQLHGYESGHQLESIINDHYVDQKRADALEALGLLAKDQLPSAKRTTNPHLRDSVPAQSTPYLRWQYEETGSHHGDTRINDSDIVETARVFGVDYPEFQRVAAVAAVLEDMRDWNPDDPRCAEFEAVIDRACLGCLNQVDLDLISDAILNQLRNSGLGDCRADIKRFLPAWLTPDEIAELSWPEQLIRFASRSMLDWGPHDGFAAVAVMKRCGTYEVVMELATRIAHFNASLQNVRPDFDCHAIPRSAARDWCQEYWREHPGSATDWEHQLQDHGFSDEAAWLSVMAPMYPFAKLRGDDVSVGLLSTRSVGNGELVT